MRISPETQKAYLDFCTKVLDQITPKKKLLLPELVKSILDVQNTNKNTAIKKMVRQSNDTNYIIENFLKIANSTNNLDIQKNLSTKINSMIALPLQSEPIRYNTGLFAKKCCSSPCIFQRALLSFRAKITTLILWVNNLGESHPNRKCILEALQNAHTLSQTTPENKEKFCTQADTIITELTKARQLLDTTAKTFTGKQRAVEITTIQTEITKLINKITTSKVQVTNTPKKAPLSQPSPEQKKSENSPETPLQSIIKLKDVKKSQQLQLAPRKTTPKRTVPKRAAAIAADAKRRELIKNKKL